MLQVEGNKSSECKDLTSRMNSCGVRVTLEARGRERLVRGREAGPRRGVGAVSVKGMLPTQCNSHKIPFKMESQSF